MCSHAEALPGTPGAKRKTLPRVEMLYAFKSVSGEFEVSRGQVRSFSTPVLVTRFCSVAEFASAEQ